MRLDTKHLHSRQIFQSPRFAKGRAWRSESTGKRLIIVGRSGDADDPGREQALYAHEYYHYHIGPNHLDYPELGSAFEPVPKEAREHQRFLLARRVSEDGWCRPENEVICVPYHGNDGVYDVDLVGYGYDRGIPENVRSDSVPNEAWKAAAIWPNPSRMVSIASLQYGWVVRSEQFAHARPRYSFEPNGLLILYSSPLETVNEARGQALYVVELIKPEEDVEWDNGPEDYSSLRISLRRLTDTGSYDPRGEIIELQQGRHKGHLKPNSPHHPVELVGLMSFNGTIITEPRPQPLIY